MDEIGVVGVRDDVEPKATVRRTEESLLDENIEIQTARGKLETLKNQGRDTCGVFKSFFH